MSVMGLLLSFAALGMIICMLFHPQQPTKKNTFYRICKIFIELCSANAAVQPEKYE